MGGIFIPNQVSNADDPVWKFVVCLLEVVVGSLQRANKSRRRSGCRRKRTHGFSVPRPDSQAMVDNSHTVRVHSL